MDFLFPIRWIGEKISSLFQRVVMKEKRRQNEQRRMLAQTVASYILKHGLETTTTGTWNVTWNYLPTGLISFEDWKQYKDRIISLILVSPTVYLAKRGVGDCIVIEFWEEQCPNVPKKPVDGNPADLKDLVDFIVTTGTNETTTGQFFLDYDVMSDFFGEEEFRTLLPKFVEELRDRKQVAEVIEDSCSDKVIDIQFYGEFCPNYEELKGEE